MSQGRIIIISGPSGVGKGTVLRQVVAHNPLLQFSVSATTRPIRPGEIDGVHYHFVDKSRFEEMLANNELLEHAVYADNYYGTPEKAVDEALSKGISVVLEIDVQGALQVMERRPDAISIFIAPPSLTELRRRLKGRGDTAEQIMQERLRVAPHECEIAQKYQYTVINNDLQQAVAEVEAILIAEACRSQYRKLQCKEEN
ncbi:MAG: guanylate kinase [Faecousia sp.]